MRGVEDGVVVGEPVENTVHEGVVENTEESPEVERDIDVV